jgi:hypothetical protein
MQYAHYYNRNLRFKRSDIFIGFQEDTPASVIFQATNFLRAAVSAVKTGSIAKEGKWSDILRWSQLNQRDCIMENIEEQEFWKNAVSFSKRGRGRVENEPHHCKHILFLKRTLFQSMQATAI